MENIDKLRELQDFNFHGNLDVKHTIEKETKKTYPKKSNTRRKYNKIQDRSDNKVNIIKVSLNRTELDLIQQIINKDLICRKIGSIAETLFDKQRYSVRLQSEQELVINKKNEKVFDNQQDAIEDFLYENVEVQEELQGHFEGNLKYILIYKNGEILPPQNLSHYQNTIDGTAFKYKINSKLFEKSLERSENPEHIKEFKTKHIINFTFKIKGIEQRFTSLQKMKNEMKKNMFTRFFVSKTEIKSSNINNLDQKIKSKVIKNITRQSNKYKRQIETTIETFFRKSNYKIIKKKDIKYLSPSRKEDIKLTQINKEMFIKINLFRKTDDINNAINEIAEYEEKKSFIKDLRWLKSVGIINHFDDGTIMINKA
tara:strand:- start:384 stop:1493 length:1110 start_codon:yes stop_codon:yes gene_type:complete